MKKKFLLGLLTLSLLTFVTSCGKDNKTKNNENKTVVETVAPTASPTAEITTELTDSPSPTADVSIKKGSEGKNILKNNTSGYSVSYDNKKLKINNTSNSISFLPKDKKAKKELNLFFNITEIDKASAKELGSQLKKSYKGHIKADKVNIGAGKTTAECFTITDSKKVTHRVYIISSDKKNCYIEMKCPSKYEKKYMAGFEEILASIKF